MSYPLNPKPRKHGAARDLAKIAGVVLVFLVLFFIWSAIEVARHPDFLPGG